MSGSAPHASPLEAVMRYHERTKHDFHEEPLSPSYESLHCPGSVASAPVTVRSVSRLLE